MKRLLIALTTSVVMLVPSVGVHADDETPTPTTDAPTTTAVTTTIPTTDAPTTIAPTTTDAPSTTAAPVSTSPTTVAPTTTVASDPCRVDGYACGWAMLDENNNVVNVIVCTVEVCGGGTWDGRKVVLQTRQMPGGNVAGYNGGTYNDSTNTFTVNGGYTLVGGSDVGDLIPPSTTTTVPAPEETPTTVDDTTATTTVPLMSSAVFGVERTTGRVSTPSLTTKRKLVSKTTPARKGVVKKPIAKK